MPNRPFDMAAPPYDAPSNVLTVNPVHRFYQNRMQINGGRNDMFVAWTDVGSLAMGHYPTEGTWLAKLAREFTARRPLLHGCLWRLEPQPLLAGLRLLAALGGRAGSSTARSSTRTATSSSRRTRRSRRSMVRRSWLNDGAYTPDGHVANTVQPPYQPSCIPPVPGGDPRFADPSDDPLPPQTGETIGSLLSAKGVDWAWYAEGWDVALADRSVIYNNDGAVELPAAPPALQLLRRLRAGHRGARKRHLKDLKDFWEDAGSRHAARGRLRQAGRQRATSIPAKAPWRPAT